VVWRWDTGWTIGGSSPGRDGNFSLHHGVQTGSGAHPTFYPMGTRGFSPGDKAAGVVKLTTQLHPVPRSRMRGAILSLPNTSSMA
jgi:hypothetical protein